MPILTHSIIYSVYHTIWDDIQGMNITGSVCDLCTMHNTLIVGIDIWGMWWDYVGHTHNTMVITLYKCHYISDDKIKRWLSRYNGGGTLSLRVLKPKDKGSVYSLKFYGKF